MNAYVGLGVGFVESDIFCISEQTSFSNQLDGHVILILGTHWEKLCTIAIILKLSSVLGSEITVNTDFVKLAECGVGFNLKAPAFKVSKASNVTIERRRFDKTYDVACLECVASRTTE